MQKVRGEEDAEEDDDEEEGIHRQPACRPVSGRYKLKWRARRREELKFSSQLTARLFDAHTVAVTWLQASTYFVCPLGRVASRLECKHSLAATSLQHR